MKHHIYFGTTSSENCTLSDAALHRASECSQCPHLESAVCVSAARSLAVVVKLWRNCLETATTRYRLVLGRFAELVQSTGHGNRRVGWRNADQDSRTQLLIFHGETG